MISSDAIGIKTKPLDALKRIGFTLPDNATLNASHFNNNFFTLRLSLPEFLAVYAVRKFKKAVAPPVVLFH
jgi:hypothetical protein